MNTAPMAPYGLTPHYDTVVTTDQPWLLISVPYDPEGDDLTYDFLWVNDPAFGPSDTTIVADVEYLTAQVAPPLNDNWRYLWAARAYDGYEYSDWSDNASFLVNSVNQAPGAFATVSPPDSAGFPIYEMLPAFLWGNSDDPDPDDDIYYTLMIATDAQFNFSFEIDSLYATEYTLTDSLEFGEEYWWKVRANDTYGLTTVSDNVRTFKTWKLGDVNADWSPDILDIIYLIDFKFKGGPEPVPLFTGDIDGDCKVDILDIIYLINYKFKAGPEPEVGCDPGV